MSEQKPESFRSIAIVPVEPGHRIVLRNANYSPSIFAGDKMIAWQITTFMDDINLPADVISHCEPVTEMGAMSGVAAGVMRPDGSVYLFYCGEFKNIAEAINGWKMMTEGWEGQECPH